MRKRRYEISLPIRHNDGRPVDQHLFDQTQDELVAKFSGRFAKVFSFLRQEDQMRQLMVDVDEDSDHLEFFHRFEADLVQRFEQIEISIATYPIEVL